MQKLTKYIKSRVSLPRKWAVYSIEKVEGTLLNGDDLMKCTGDIPPVAENSGQDPWDRTFFIPMKIYNKIYDQK